MFLWTKPLGLKTFRNTIEKATESAVLAANQGLYNGFLAAGLAWGLIHSEPGSFAFQIKASPAPRDRGRRLWRGDRQPPDLYVQAAPWRCVVLLVGGLDRPTCPVTALRRESVPARLPGNDDAAIRTDGGHDHWSR